MLVTWSESMSVGVPMLDSDHKSLIGLINLLHRSVGDSEEGSAVASVIGALEDYATHHFAREESMMAAARFPQLDSHRQGHLRFIEQVAALKVRYAELPCPARAQECLTFLNDWLVSHICTADMNYRAWVVGHAAAQIEGERYDPPRRSGAPDLRSLRILVVDDNLTFCEILAAILGSVGMAGLDMVHDLTTAKTALVDKTPDLLICDWHVGEENGLDLIKWLRQGEPALAELPVLMLSGHERMINRDLALLAGADEFMEKPVTARGLLICLSRLAGKEGGRHERP